jgi:putative ABC transport system permease protein
MIRNYLLIAYRNLLRHSSISFINILGLSLGLACTMFIYLWVTDELSFDRFHKKADRIYRVEEDQHYTNGVYHVTVTPWPSGPVWKEQIPEIENACRIAWSGGLLFRYNATAFYEGNVRAVDSTFFRMFSFPMVKGDPITALKEPNSLVITEKVARKYFGKEDPLGKTLQVNNTEVFKVTGVIREMPTNSSLQVDILLPFDYMKKSSWYSENWDNNSILTYVLLRDNAKSDPVNKKLTEVVKSHNAENTTDFSLAPYVREHLYSHFGYGHQPGAILSVYIFAAIAFLVLIIACINFMNLSTARSSARAKEIGLRKVTGAHRKNLVVQFFSESVMMAILAMLIAVFIVSLLLQPFNTLSGKSFTEADLWHPVFIWGSIIITLLTGILAGTYPSIVLSSFQPIRTMRGDLSQGSKGGLFRKITVVLQFTLSIILITSTLVVYRQLHYMQSRKLGYDKENLLYISLRGDMVKSYDVIKQELLKEPLVQSVSASSHPPHQIGSNSGGVNWEGKDPDMQTLISMSGVDFDYVETMGIEMKSGRSFSKDFPGDAAHDTVASFLINEKMEQLMDKENVLGMSLSFMGYKGPIVGVMKDFHYQSMRSVIEPLAIAIVPRDWWGFIYVRVKPGDLKQTMKQLEKSWNRIMPSYPFEYFFVDDEFDNMYRSEERMGTLMNYFAVLAILIACIGLFGLANYTAEKKTREVGIRKAMGAPVHSILILFSKEFIQLLLIAAVISCPAAWYLLLSWLKSFGYHTSLNIWIFVGAALGALFIALLAITFQAIKSAQTNPAETLKYE